MHPATPQHTHLGAGGAGVGGDGLERGDGAVGQHAGRLVRVAQDLRAAGERGRGLVSPRGRQPSLKVCVCGGGGVGWGGGGRGQAGA